MCSRWSFLPLILLISGCDIINPKEDLPVYLTVDNVSVNPGAGEGTSSHKIEDVWIYINDDLLGAFELPVRIPVLESGSKKLSIVAGVLDNGSSAIHAQYPYYTSYDITMNFTGTERSASPVFKYHSSADFSFIDDFELGTHF